MTCVVARPTYTVALAYSHSDRSYLQATYILLEPGPRHVCDVGVCSLCGVFEYDYEVVRGMIQRQCDRLSDQKEQGSGVYVLVANKHPGTLRAQSLWAVKSAAGQGCAWRDRTLFD